MIGSEIELSLPEIAHHWSVEPDSSWALLDSLGLSAESGTKIRVMALDSGLLSLAVFALTEASETLATHQMEFEISMPKASPEIEIEDIHEPLDPGYDYWRIALILLAALAVGIVFIALLRHLLKQRKSLAPKLEPQMIQTNPYREALEKLAALRADQAWLKLAPREYYTQATDIYRTYLKKALGIDSLERSNTETLELLELEGWPLNDVEDLRLLMYRADLAKYADERIKESLSEDLDLVERFLSIHDREKSPAAEESSPID